MYKKMLVPLDGSERAQVALPYATRLAGRLGLEIVLLNVCPDNHLEFIEWHREYIDLMVQKVNGMLEEMGGKGAAAVAVRGDVVSGDPARRILEYSYGNGFDLILIGTHGESGTRRWAMGSIVDKVLQASKVPVWLVRAGVPEEIVHDLWPRRTILVPLDGSELAESVLPHVETLIKRKPEVVDVVLLSVCEATPVPSFYPADIRLDTEEECYRCRVDGERYLSAIAERLKGAGASVRSLVVVGKAADQIVDYASQNRVSVIVMTTHGASGSGWTYGSVAERVLLGTTAPILLIRPD